MYTCRSTEPGITVSTYDPRYRGDFVSLNEEWVTKYFVLEDTDRKYLDDPERTIVEPGGDIVFLLEGDRAVATCALIPYKTGVFELAKMAVLESERGRGLGNLLMDATIRRGREIGARKIFLLSNTKLKPAVNLYKKFGFKTVHQGPNPSYERCNIEMVLFLDPTT